MFAAATTSDALPVAAGNGETAVTDCQLAVDNLCLDDDGTRLMCLVGLYG